MSLAQGHPLRDDDDVTADDSGSVRAKKLSNGNQSRTDHHSAGLRAPPTAPMDGAAPVNPCRSTSIKGVT
jgi:hypothetical protein